MDHFEKILSDFRATATRVVRERDAAQALLAVGGRHGA